MQIIKPLQEMIDAGELIVAVFHTDGTATVHTVTSVSVNGEAVQIGINEEE